MNGQGDETRVTIAQVAQISVSRLGEMTASEAGLFVADAMLRSNIAEWSIPNMRAHAEASVRQSSPRINGLQTMPNDFTALDLSWVLGDAFGWLISRGLVGPASEQSGSAGEYRLTSAGRSAAEAGNAGQAEATYRLHADLHPVLIESRLLFERGSYQIAVFAATHQVEVRVRELAGFGPDVYGT